MKKIALLTKYGTLAASTRQRFVQYQPLLEQTGFALESRPLLDDAYLEQLYDGGKRDPRHVAARYMERLRWLLAKCDADILWLHCELFPYLSGGIELLARLPGKPIIFDYDDAIFHNYDLHRNPVVRATLGRKLHVTIGGADVVFAGNGYLADYARQHCKNVQIIPTVVDVTVYHAGAASGRDSETRIGWIGSPSTWVEYMEPMMPLIGEVAAVTGARCIAVGADKGASPMPWLDFLPWSEETEVQSIQQMDIGLMPLTDTPWARGKCGYKLIQYMACGLPVVASPVGMNAEIVEHGVNGFLASTEAEWRSALITLASDPDLRRRMGAAGRRKVEDHFSLQVWGPRVAALLAEVAGKART